jgi:uncharacterized protein (TIGR02466 family)
MLCLTLVTLSPSVKYPVMKAAMPHITPLFASPLYRADGEEGLPETLLQELLTASLSISEDDEAGQAWCEEKGYPGYTSYASLDDLPWRVPEFKTLVKVLDAHVAAFSDHLEYDLKKGKLKLDALWINILPTGGMHSGHIHPHSVISGTTYLAVPEGAGALKFEDPRLPMMMAAPPRKANASRPLQSFVYETPQAGTILLWESFLRHEVPMNLSDEERVSLSFNYAWG